MTEMKDERQTLRTSEFQKYVNYIHSEFERIESERTKEQDKFNKVI